MSRGEGGDKSEEDCRGERRADKSQGVSQESRGDGRWRVEDIEEDAFMFVRFHDDHNKEVYMVIAITTCRHPRNF